ncbi:MAG: adenylate/guanylate cyclase domain-containing protein [Pseudomonadota bacterium]
MAEQDMEPERGNEELWYHVFAVGAGDLLDQRGFHSRLPSPPRCRLCKVPFQGLGGLILRFRGKSRAKRNPNYCSACDQFLAANPGGAEVPMAILYADIRKSTEFVQAHAPAEVLRRTNAFLELATRAITENDGFVLAFYGDCVLANWPPGFSGSDYREKAVKTAEELSGASQKAGIPVGVGLHAGTAYMCSVQANQGSFRDVSVFGEAVNIAARLSSAAAAGEVLGSAEMAEIAETKGPEQSFDLKGFNDPVAAWRIGRT